MRVSRLEIFGFKSFMERLILPLQEGVTGVVGPNGCGKSNIVDALRWVLGETNARSLRGGVLEDVIFNGTDKLRPLGLAEVSLTLQSESDSLYDDILKVSKEGELQAELEKAETDIQRVSDKLREITKEQIEQTEESQAESVEDTVVQETSNEADESESGRPHLRVISRGEEVPDTDETTIEEAPVESTPVTPVISEAALQQKFGWLKNVSEVQVARRLYRSGESEYFLNRTPCRLRDLKEFFRIIGISARTFTIVAQGEVSRIVTSKPEQRRKIFEEAAGVLGLRDKIAAAERRLKDTADNVARLEDIEKEVERQVNSLKRQANKAKRREGLKTELQEAERTIFSEKQRRLKVQLHSLTNSLESAQKEEASLVAQHEESAAKESRLRSELLQAEVQSEELRGNLETLKDALNERGRKEEAFRSRIHELQALRESKHNEKDKVSERLQTLQERRQTSTSRIESLEKQERELNEELSHLESDLDSNIEQLTQEVHNTRDELGEEEKTLQQIREQMSRIEGELRAMTTQLHADSLYEVLEREENQSLRETVESLNGEMPQLVAEVMNIEEPYIKAVQAALGERASFFIANNTAALAKAFHELQETQASQQEFWFGLIRAVSDSNPIETSFPLPSLGQYVKALDASHEEFIRTLLQDVYLAPSFDEARALFEAGKIPLGITIVTAEGHVFTASTCSSSRDRKGLLDIQQQRTVLAEEQEQIEERANAQQEKVHETQERLTLKEKEQAEAIRQKQQKDELLKELTNKRSTLLGHLDAERRVLVQLQQDISSTEGEDREIQEFTSALEQQGEETNASLQLLLQDDQSKIEVEAEHIRERLEERDTTRKQLREQYDALRNATSSEWRTLEEVRQSVSKYKLDLEKTRLESAHLQETAEDRLPGEIIQAIFSAPLSEGESQEALVDEQSFSKFEARAADIRSQLLREGEVDPESIEQYETESQRLEELQAQKRDLVDASNTLQKTVGMLREQSVARFVETFEQVKSHFVTLMPRLFGGGKADLVLADPNNPLESGIDVILRPPGKKPKSLDLLSGGEKALCATSLIISLFLVRPSPLCVLDEVDAPLDEANLVRFLSVVKEMSQHTQFIMITHNKASMAAADRLVGVTMQKPGASSVLTVSLEEAYEQVA